MAWSITRKATDEDVALLEKRARAFAQRHEMVRWNKADNWVCTVEFHIDYLRLSDGMEIDRLEGQRLQELWKRIANRAIGDDGIARGYVGHSAD